MAKRKQFEQSEYERRIRHFSEEFKKQKVHELERKVTTIAEISEEYEVSNTSVYNWLYKYSKSRKKGQTVVIETQSDTRKLMESRERIKELEQIIGQKQMEIDFQSKIIELAEKEYGVDIKKKFSTKPCSGTGSTVKRTITK